MTDPQEEWETPPETKGMSVREARRTRAVWEDKKAQEMIEVGMDPLFRQDAIRGSQPLIRLLRSPSGIVSSMEIAQALSPERLDPAPYQVTGKLQAKLGGLGSGYSIKLSSSGAAGGQTRYFSKQAVCIIGMHSWGLAAQSFRAWMAEVVKRASEHPDFKDLMEWKHPED